MAEAKRTEMKKTEQTEIAKDKDKLQKYRRACKDQMDEMQKMKNAQQSKDKIEEERAMKGIGGNFMDAVFEEKKHISY